MDLVRLSATAGMVMMGTLIAAANSSAGRAQQLPLQELQEPSSGASTRVQTRIEAAFTTTADVPVADPTGPLFPSRVGLPNTSMTASHATLPPSGPLIGRWAAHIEEASRRFGVPADWVRGVMRQESGGLTHLNGRPITSHAGAMGLMQVMPGTFAEMSALHGLGSDPHDPRANILAGTAYLRAMYDRYGPSYFLAAYNAGPGRVDDHLRTGRALPGETRAYTAAVAPRLVPGAAITPATMSSGVQDLTSTGAMSAFTAAPSQPRFRASVDPSNASVFAASSTASTAADRPVGAQPTNGLFVTLTAADRRRDRDRDQVRED